MTNNFAITDYINVYTWFNAANTFMPIGDEDEFDEPDKYTDVSNNEIDHVPP